MTYSQLTLATRRFSACDGAVQSDVADQQSVTQKMPKRSRNGTSFARNGADSNRGGRNNGWLDFAATPMGIGESRLAYRCRVRDGCYY